MEFNYLHFSDLLSESLEKRAEGILNPSHSIDEIDAYRLIFSCIDHTSLEATDHQARIVDFCKTAVEFGSMAGGGLHVAAVCVYPVFAAAAAGELKGSGILTACVAGAFPSGQAPLHTRLEEARFAIGQGAEEIDMVISRGRLMAGEYDFVFDEIAAFREVCGHRTKLKVILETGELKEALLICKASEIALKAGADFLKTSTGKISTGATAPALLLMMDCIRAWHADSGKKCGIKASGGIVEPQQALDCYLLVKACLGHDWLDPMVFRIGASRLTPRVLAMCSDNNG
ncbi:MAG TPA: deoxyribose-phosphate aldolase [Bacteroidales bacterium]|nr:deoxyribose-phosphate aldolase [Bacteroidales bacterium]HSA42825.1 deoxyribose-phosphate aldolase [Bacteroidales bacterium]